ncbi:hypothetical protein GQ600_20301 [Phytophthora cactorum]|nr:hypothetical protein GQ600_20301 [Phytophthora cactorum]
MSMQLDLGQPSVSFTHLPSSGTYHVGNLADDISSCVPKRARSSINHCLQFTQARLGMTATKTRQRARGMFLHSYPAIGRILLINGLYTGQPGTLIT